MKFDIGDVVKAEVHGYTVVARVEDVYENTLDYPDGVHWNFTGTILESDWEAYPVGEIVKRLYCIYFVREISIF